jgi:toxin ParE1/3/4
MPPDKFRVIWSPESEADLLSIWSWGASRFSAEAADRHLRDIQRAVAALETSPEIGRTRDDLRPGIREIVVYPTVVFYRIAATRIEVIRVVDGRRHLAALFVGD